MSRKSRLPQSRRHIWVYDEDWAFLDRWYGMNSAARIGTGASCREIIHAKVQRLRAGQIQSMDASPAIEEGDT